MKRTNGNNFQRVIAATRVIYKYMNNSGLFRPHRFHPPEQTWIDLLTDLRHMAGATLVDFDKVLTASEHHYLKEMRERL